MAPYRALDVAKWILTKVNRDAGETITHLKLQKLVYYSQAWSLALRGTPLFDEDMQAWAHGPVAESVFDVYREHSWDPIPAPTLVPKIASEDADHIDEVVAVYSEYSAKQLENMTHGEDPWISTRGNLEPEMRSNKPIPKDVMARFYKEQYDSVDE